MKKLLPLFYFLMLCASISAHSNASLGVKVNHVSEKKAKKMDLNNPHGGLVSWVYPNSVADKAGIKVFDYIYQINDQKTTDDKSLSDLLNEYQPGDKVSVSYIREGKTKKAKLTLDDKNELDRSHTPSSKDPFLGVNFRHDNDAEKVNGAKVDILHNSTAQAMGMEDGDRVIRIDNYPIYDWHDLSIAIDAREVGENITIEVNRDGEQLEFSRPIKSRAATHNDHSRPNGPVIVEGDPEDNTVAEVILEDISEEEAIVLEEETETEMPVISNLKVTKLNVFPNPSTGIFDIEFTLPENGQTVIRIFSASGQQIYANNLGQFEGTFSDRIDIANNVRGAYFLQVMQGQTNLSRKIILQ